ncbi:MAG: YhbY family RNA-binding protein [Anaeroplasmataceae bacterium]|nr:YhbY family RNA-binding protein [Anaeroplasmataceae bacterium]
MLTPKQKAYLKSLAHPLKACFQIGKEGLSENLRTDLLNYLKKHELMKVSILNNSSVTIEEIEPFLYEVDIELVQKIGHILVLYKHSDDAKNPILLPVKTK